MTSPNRLDGSAQLASTLIELVSAVSESDHVSDYLRTALPLINRQLASDSAAVFCAQQGHWRALEQSGTNRKVPEELLSETLDRGASLRHDRWVSAPVGPRQGGEVFVAHQSLEASASEMSPVDSVARMLSYALEAIRGRFRLQNRLVRLDAMLDIAGRWNQIRETETLLVEIAHAACRLLKADRASIFLWDRYSHTLIARPALGVKGNELRVSDAGGVVGQVLQTGVALRVNRQGDQEQIDRETDTKLGYVTHSLLCVPLVGRNGQRFGVFETINKHDGEFTDDDEEALIELAAHAAVALENVQERETLIRTQKQIVDQAAAHVELIGESAPIKSLQETVRRVADTDLAVLLLGENGTGKEVVARSLHYQSRRRNKPFIAVNCAAIAESLLESELFGHEQGAFTDAREARAGKFELASGGTLFLDEIGDLSLPGQAKLLRVLEEKIVVRVGGSLPIHTDVRVIAATNRNPVEMVRQHQFREDLYFRLNVVAMELPALRARGTDVLLLAEYFLQQFSSRIGRTTPRWSEAARARILQHPWPGNVRELRNLMERVAYLLPEDTIDAADLAFTLTPAESNQANVASGLALSEATDRFQMEYIKQAVERSGGNMSDAATRLGLHRSNLYRKMNQLGMKTD